MLCLYTTTSLIYIYISLTVPYGSGSFNEMTQGPLPDGMRMEFKWQLLYQVITIQPRKLL